jgi:translation initiation factor IF-3
MSKTKNERALVNERIAEVVESGKVRLISDTGEQLGVVETRMALSEARERNLDLVLVAPEANPPVCKIMDYGKRLFDIKKARALQRRNQKQIHVKEIKFRPGTEQGDYRIKLRKLREFLEDGDKTKISLRFRGREMVHQELGLEMLKRVETDLQEYATVEVEPALEGRQMIMVLAPLARGKKGPSRSKRSNPEAEDIEENLQPESN